MNQDEYIIAKLKAHMPYQLSDLISYMREHNRHMYIAGGAITSLATNKDINDYDCYFADVTACVEAIRVMKEDNPYIGFISDKSITYVLEDGVNMQFVYNNFYNNAEDIFKTFDFTCVMGAYDCLHEKIVYDDNFWMHNSQKFLSFNNKTSFPIISLLRVGKYKSRGYKISRNEMLKISLAISQLELSSWEEAAEQLGNTYGLSLASFDATDNEPFSIEALLERIQAVSDGEDLPMSEVYKYSPHVVDFVVLGKPVEYIEINGETIYTDPDAYNCERELEDMIEKGVLESVELGKEEYLGGDWYVVMSDKHTIGETIKSYVGYYAYRREQLSTNNLSYDDIVCKVTFDERDIYTFEKGEYPVLTSFTIDEIICRKTMCMISHKENW